MKTLVWKELRENVKLALLGLGIYTLLLLQVYRTYEQTRRDVAQPLTEGNFLMGTLWFCCIFGAALGWLQVHNERRPDLWAYLIHRPSTRTRIFLSKTIAGLALYALVAGLPLLGFMVWARLPGHVAAPFEWRMLRPAATLFLTGTLFYFAGMLTGLRQARWYASRALGLGAALAVVFSLRDVPEFWQALAMLFIASAILITAVWGGFQTDGHYQGQPAWSKAALSTTLMVGSLVVVAVAAGFLSTLLPSPENAGPWFGYAMTTNGTVFKLTTTMDQSPERIHLVAEPLLGAKAGIITNRTEFQQLSAKGAVFSVDPGDRNNHRNWIQADSSLFSVWRASTETVWYYWDRYGRLIGHDRIIGRFIGSLGPKGFAPNIAGAGDRFNNGTGGSHNQTLATDTTVLEVEVEQRAVKPLFTTAETDPILAVQEIASNDHDWDYTVVVTRKAIHLLTRGGQPLWAMPYEPAYPDYTKIQVDLLQPAGQFALWLSPSDRAQGLAKGTLPSHVTWLASAQGVVKTADLPALPARRFEPMPLTKLLACVMPPTLLVAVHLALRNSGPQEVTPNILLLNGAVAVFVCLSIVWWLGRRYRFSLAAQVGWGVFYLLFGVPGLLAFLCVQEWPAREACPNCKKLRVVARAQCEHCGAPFAPPQPTGTEVFAALGERA